MRPLELTPTRTTNRLPKCWSASARKCALLPDGGAEGGQDLHQQGDGIGLGVRLDDPHDVPGQAVKHLCGTLGQTPLPQGAGLKRGGSSCGLVAVVVHFASPSFLAAVGFAGPTGRAYRPFPVVGSFLPLVTAQAGAEEQALDLPGVLGVEGKEGA